MRDDPPDADEIADLLLPLDGPYPPDRIIEAARTIGELVRRLNHATFSRSALRYPPQLYRTVSALRSGLYGLEQTFTQLANRLDAFTTDPRVEHDRRHDPSIACADAAAQLRQAAAAIQVVTAPLDAAAQTTSHLGYDTSTARPQPRPAPRRHGGQDPPPPPMSPPPPPTRPHAR